MDPTQVTFAGLLAIIISGSLWAIRYILKKTLEEGGVWDTLKAWGERAVKSLETSHEELSANTRATSDRTAALHDQTSAVWRANCRYMKAEIMTRDLSEEDRVTLISHIDKIEQGLSR